MLAESLSWSLAWGWRICCQDGSLTWLLAGGLCFSPKETLHSSLSVFTSQQLASSRSSDPREKEQGRKATMSCLALEVRLYSIDHRDQSWYSWRGTTHGQEYQRQESLGSILKASCHSNLAFYQPTLTPSFSVDALPSFWRPGSGSQVEFGLAKVWFVNLGNLLKCWAKSDVNFSQRN